MPSQRARVRLHSFVSLDDPQQGQLSGAGITTRSTRSSPHPQRARPDEATPLQAFCEQAGALAVMPDHLQEIAATTAEAKQVAAQRAAMQDLLNLQCQRRKAPSNYVRQVQQNRSWVRPSHTRMPAGNGIIVAVHQSAPPRLRSASPRQPRP